MGILVFVVLNIGACQVWYAPRKEEAVKDKKKFDRMKDEAEAAMTGEVSTGESKDPAGVLAAVLHGLQRGAQLRRDGVVVNNSSEAAHRKGL